MSEALRVSLVGVGLLGPGFDGWASSRSVLAGERPWTCGTMPERQLTMLAATERRRCPQRVRIALAVAQEALDMSGLPAEEVATVFAASDTDGQLTHLTYEALAGSPPIVSPTRFQNLVHNAAAGYWGIATRSQAAATSICAFGATFAAALLDAASQACVEDSPVLVIVYDQPFPPPLSALHPMDAGLAVALLLRPEQHPRRIAALELAIGDAPATLAFADAVPAPMRRTPSAHCLPLLAAIASGHAGVVEIPYLDGTAVEVRLR